MWSQPALRLFTDAQQEVTITPTTMNFIAGHKIYVTVLMTIGRYIKKFDIYRIPVDTPGHNLQHM